VFFTVLAYFAYFSQAVWRADMFLAASVKLVLRDESNWSKLHAEVNWS